VTAPMTPSAPDAPPVAPGVEVHTPDGLMPRRDTAAGPESRGRDEGPAAAPRVLGVDLSLTATGLAGPGWCHLIASRHDGDEWSKRSRRLRRIREEVLEFAMPAELVVIEGPAYGAVSQSTWDRAGLWWSIVAVLESCEVPYAVVSPSQRLMYASGSGQPPKGRKSKGVVVDAVTRRYPEYDTAGDDNLADAVVFMAMGCRALGRPLEDSLPQTHLRAMDKVVWPEVTW
jgi:hypothetical protein